ncbi:MAG: hypothetical protein K2R98_05280 [Gemmataceae bacterium]|nr:hypothetical protein [Gemmataceae bacterium]
MDQEARKARTRKGRRGKSRRKVVQLAFDPDESQSKARPARQPQQSPRTAAADACERVLGEIEVQVVRLREEGFKGVLAGVKHDATRLRELIEELKRSKRGDRTTLKAHRVFEEVWNWKRQDRKNRETVVALCKRLRISRPTFYRLLTTVDDWDKDLHRPIMDRCRAVIGSMTEKVDRFYQFSVQVGNPISELELIQLKIPTLMMRIVDLHRAKKGSRRPAKVTEVIRYKIMAWQREDSTKRETITSFCRREGISRPTFRKVLRDLEDE